MKFHNKEPLNAAPPKLIPIDSEESYEIIKISNDDLRKNSSSEKSRREAAKPLYLFRYE